MTIDSFAMLTQEDWALLREQAKSATYHRGEILLQEGSRQRTLFIIREGLVRVEHDLQGQGITLAQLGPGEIVGEIGFVENTPASASVVAQDDVTVERIDEAVLQSIIASTPGFAIRFYHSLAIALSRRLRATSRRLSQSGAGEMAQISRFHQARTGNITARQIPAEISSALNDFELSMLELDQALRAGQVEETEAQSRLSAASDHILALLEQTTESQPLVEMGWDDLLSFRDPDRLEVGVGDYVFRETFRTLMLSATIARCYAKPRGFPDDHETVTTIYRNEAEGDGRLGPLVDRWFLNRPICGSRRASRDLMRATLEQLAGQWPGDLVRMTSLASGTAAELFALLKTEAGSRVAATCVDLDAEALLAAAQRAGREQTGDRMTFQEGNAVPLDVEGAAVPPQHVVYALGLGEYLTDEQMVAVLDWAYVHLVESGTVVFTNLDTANPDRVLMEHLLDWKVNHRSAGQLRAIFARSLFGTEAVRVESDETGVTLLAHGTKNKG